MKKYFTIKELFGRVEKKSDILLYGDYWGISYENGQYLLSFISGEMIGLEKRIEIDVSDYLLLKQYPGKIEDIINKYCN
ncbi:hypothetical protein EDC44_12826 [Cricetibacter osteomyelitidis]|uniref:Uncharacterized protein n=1 Tax=Cricetibacter osteomyelitidis TaxID=1521931 RepID=A0A4V2T131_9PAST|nr:hypothetical protein [Cricetibacter osteomyelitidis]TCP92073.1 hypothetical protein EDC44_12826 [Cricetibacter osteomyelitidis]